MNAPRPPLPPLRPVPFFRSRESQDELRAIVATWLGTPFHDQAGIKGVGVDCVHLWAEIMVEAGHLQSYVFPRYHLDAGHHDDASALLAWFEAHPGFRMVNGPLRSAEPMPGDLYCYRIGKSAHHLAGCVEWPRGVHVMRGTTVCEMRFDDPTFASRFVASFRPVFW
mgnify:CR=1 FL=1